MYKVYELTNDDVLLFESIATLFLDGKFDVSRMKYFLDNAYNHAVVVLDDSKPIGFAYGYTLIRLNSEPMFYIHSVDVLKEHRKQGVGTMLMNKLIEIGNRHDCYKGFIITNKSNNNACKLYEKVGGKVVYNDDVVYEWKK